MSVAPREHFLSAGDDSTRVGLVVEGVFRVYRIARDGAENVKTFRTEGELVGAYAEALRGVPALNFVQALEPSRVLAFRLTDVERLATGHPCWERLLRRVAEWHYVQKETREHELLTLSAAERLRQFERASPHLVGRVPKREIAAYLGITAEALSRILARRRRAASAS